MRPSWGESHSQLHSQKREHRQQSAAAPTHPSAAMLTACQSMAPLKRIRCFSAGRPIILTRLGSDCRGGLSEASAERNP